MDFKLYDETNIFIQKLYIQGAIHHLERILAAEPSDRFKGLLNSSFTNSPQDLRKGISLLIDRWSNLFSVESCYLEMNGFDINPDLWFFDPFGYSSYDADDLDWLCEWQSPEPVYVPLTGLEHVQRDFEWYHSNKIYEDQSFERLYTTALLLVLCKYLELIQTALATGPLSKNIPVLATAHDFDIIARFNVKN